MTRIISIVLAICINFAAQADDVTDITTKYFYDNPLRAENKLGRCIR
jgi:hypothetical protein